MPEQTVKEDYVAGLHREEDLTLALQRGGRHTEILQVKEYRRVFRGLREHPTLGFPCEDTAPCAGGIVSCAGERHETTEAAGNGLRHFITASEVERVLDIFCVR